MAQSKKSTRKMKDAPEDIITLILQDHLPLKELIETMKDDDAGFEEKKEAFEEFAPMLLAHAKPEEETLYIRMKEEDELKVEGLEGDVEHALAEQLCEELQATGDEDMFKAKVKVLAEMVEHHIEEEEEEMLPDFRENSSEEERVELGMMYLAMKADAEASDVPGAMISKKKAAKGQSRTRQA